MEEDDRLLLDDQERGVAELWDLREDEGRGPETARSVEVPLGRVGAAAVLPAYRAWRTRGTCQACAPK